MSSPISGKNREISKSYYDSHKNQVSPVVTGIQNGFVHQYHILMFQCDECEKSFEYHDDLRPVDGNHYHGYDVDYLLMSKEEVITWSTKFHFSIDSFVDTCRTGNFV